MSAEEIAGSPAGDAAGAEAAPGEDAAGAAPTPAELAAGVATPAGEAAALAETVTALAETVTALAGAVNALAGRLATVERTVGRAAARLDSRSRDATRDVEALLQLYRDHTPRAPMPPSGGWAIDPTGLLELLSHVRADRPALVLELGSGTSSVWLGYALERTGGRLVSVDHDARFGERTRQLLRRHGLADVVQVRDAPLRDLELGGRTYQWYDPAAFEDVDGVDLLVVDGPPGAIGPMARYPALPVLWRRLSPGALVLLDDAGRPDERDAVTRWLAEVGGLATEPAVVGNVAVLRYTRPAGDQDTPGDPHRWAQTR